jgi:hypothetical protein
MVHVVQDKKVINHSVHDQSDVKEKKVNVKAVKVDSVANKVNSVVITTVVMVVVSVVHVNKAIDNKAEIDNNKVEIDQLVVVDSVDNVVDLHKTPNTSENSTVTLAVIKLVSKLLTKKMAPVKVTGVLTMTNLPSS